jgi:hypothetical protein
LREVHDMVSSGERRPAVEAIPEFVAGCERS